MLISAVPCIRNLRNTIIIRVRTENILPRGAQPQPDQKWVFVIISGVGY